MNSNLIEFARYRTGIARVDIEAVLQCLADFTVAEMRCGRAVNLYCFGKFYPKFWPGRPSGGPNPTLISGRVIAKFKASEILSHHLNTP